MDLQILDSGKLAISVRGTRRRATSSLVGTHSGVIAISWANNWKRQQLGERLQIKERLGHCSLAVADCRDWELFVDSRPLSRLGEDRPGPIPGLVRSRELKHFGDSRSS